MANDYNADAIITNCTFVENISKVSGGGILNYRSNTIISNTIIWGNKADSSGNELSFTADGFSKINNSCFKNSKTDIFGNNFSQSNCIYDNPRFYINGINFALAGNSACIDKGNDSLINTEFDIRGIGFPRKLNGITGGIGRVDIGAYEYQFGTDPITSVNESFNETKNKIKVFPNPFSNSTEVIYELAEDCEIELTLYNISGMKVQNLASGKQTKGTHKLTLNSESLSSGSYNLILTSCGKSVTEKVVVVK